MKVAVTGASGFVGRHVLGALSQLHDVELVATSRFGPNSGTAPRDLRHVPLDLANPPADAFERLGRPDTLIHLAWGGLPNYSSPHHFETELLRHYGFLRGLVDAGLRSLLVTGTCYEYGMRCGELDESPPAQPANAYAFAKESLRRQLEFLQSEAGFALTWARLFYMYGEGQAPSSLYPQLMAAIARGDAAFRMSGGEQLRDYLPVGEVAAHLSALATRHPGSGIVNVCSGRPVSVRNLVEGLMRESRVELALELGAYPYPDYEPMAFWGSAKRLTQLGARPRVTCD